MLKQRVVDPDTQTLLAWVQAICTGGVVDCEMKRIAVQSSLGLSMNINLDPGFAAKHAGLATALRKAANASKGKWHLGRADSSTIGKNKSMSSFDIARKRDIVDFLLHARRVDLAHQDALVASC